MNYYRQQFFSPATKAVFIVILTVLFFFVPQVKAATYTSAGNGAWTLPTNWSPASGVGGPTANDVVVITHNITLAGGSSFNGTGSLTIQSNGILTVTGNYSIGTNGTRIIVSSTGSLVVQGTFTIGSQAFLALQGGAISTGTLILSDYSTSGINYTSGTIAITGSGSIYIGAGETFSYPLTLNVPSGVTVKNGSTLSATGVSGAIILDVGSILILPSGNVTPSSISLTAASTELRVAGAAVTYGTAINLTAGKISVNSGTFTLNNTLTVNGGTFTTAVGGTASATALTVSTSGTAVYSNAGTTNVSGAVSFSNAVTNSGTLRITGASGTFINNNGTFTNTGTVSTSSTATFRATTNNSGTFNVGTSASPANLVTTNSGGNLTNTGFLNVTGNATIGGTLSLAPFNPGSPVVPKTSRMIVSGNLTVPSVGMSVGTAVAPPEYADLIVYGNVSTSGGAITVNCNGRVAMFGDLGISGGGGNNLNILNCGVDGSGKPIGGQVYVDGDGSGNTITNTSSASTVNNNNPNFTSGGTPNTPYGFYVNGPVFGPADADRGTLASMQTSNAPFYSWVQTYLNNPLPVVIAYFKVTSTDKNGITLSWSTAMEKDFDHFELEHAGEDLAFRKLATVDAQGGINVDTKYQFVHSAPKQGKNYYRLKSIDVDGSFVYSEVIAGNWSGADRGVSLYPNPIMNHTFTLELNDARTTPVNLSLIEARGVVVYTAKVDETTSTINLPEDLKPGVYIAKISDASGQQMIRVVIN